MLHWFITNERLIFWDEAAPEMQLPRYLSMRSRGLGKIQWLGAAWQVNADAKDIFVSYAESIGRRMCPHCSETHPCSRMAWYISHWASECAARADRARQREEREEAKARFRNPFENKGKQTPKKPKMDKREAAAASLGLHWPCTKDQVSQAFREKILKAHPDLGGTDEKAKEIISAREILMQHLS